MCADSPWLQEGKLLEAMESLRVQGALVAEAPVADSLGDDSPAHAPGGASGSLPGVAAAESATPGGANAQPRKVKEAALQSTGAVDVQAAWQDYILLRVPKVGTSRTCCMTHTVKYRGRSRWPSDTESESDNHNSICMCRICVCMCKYVHVFVCIAYLRCYPGIELHQSQRV